MGGSQAPSESFGGELRHIWWDKFQSLKRHFSQDRESTKLQGRGRRNRKQITKLGLILSMFLCFYSGKVTCFGGLAYEPICIRFSFAFRPPNTRILPNTLRFCCFSSTRLFYTAWYWTKTQLFQNTERIVILENADYLRCTVYTSETKQGLYAIGAGSLCKRVSNNLPLLVVGSTSLKIHLFSKYAMSIGFRLPL
jgi:hypothetical protein